MEATPIQMAAPESIGSGRPGSSSPATGMGEPEASFDRVLSEVSANSQDQAEHESDTSDPDGDTTAASSSSISGVLLGDWLLRNNLVVPLVVIGNQPGQTAGDTTPQSGEINAGVSSIGSTTSTATLTVQMPVVGPDTQGQTAGTLIDQGSDTPLATQVGESTLAAVNSGSAAATVPTRETAVSASRNNTGGSDPTQSGAASGRIMQESEADQPNQQSSGGDSGSSSSQTGVVYERIQGLASQADQSSNFSVSVDGEDATPQPRIENGSTLPGVMQVGSQTSGINEGASISPVIENTKGVDLGDSLVKQIDQGIHLLSFPRRREVRVTLEPESLGKVNINIIQEKDGGMVVKMTADSPIARDLIESRLQELKAAFDRQGIKIEGFSIDLGHSPAFFAGDQGQGRGFNPGEPNARILPFISRDADLNGEELLAGDIRSRTGTGMVDLRA